MYGCVIVDPIHIFRSPIRVIRMSPADYVIKIEPAQIPQSTQESQDWTHCVCL